MFKMSSVWSNASLKTWTPQLDCFVNELLNFDYHRLLQPAAMLPFDGAVCFDLLQQFKCPRLLGNSTMRL